MSEFVITQEDSKFVITQEDSTFVIQTTEVLGAIKFNNLLDTPDSYVGNANKIVVVNEAEDGLEFTDSPSVVDWDEIGGDQTDISLSGFTNDLTTDNLDEGTTNLYFTEDRATANFDSNLGEATTTDLAEGTNLYYTEARVSANSSVVANTAKVSFDWDYDYDDLINNPTTITTDQASAIIANTAKVSYNSTDSTKVGYISVTQPVNLDTMESNIATNNAKISFDSTSSTRLANTSGTNTGDNAVNSNYSSLVTNQTHTGDVTGSTSLTIDKTAITSKTEVDSSGNDYVLISDTSDSGNLKKVLASDFGVGAVTSVAVSGSDGIEVDSGSPITTSGTIALGINKSTMLSTLNIEDGAEVNNISDTNATDLTDGGATTLHKHSYNNLDDKPSIPTQYTDEMSQDAVGNILVDSSEIDFTYTDATPSITASLKLSSIDESKLDTSVNASLDKADSALQSTDIGTSVQAHSTTLDNTTASFTTTLASNIATNNAKVGITPTQASNITTNNAKISYTDATAVGLNTTHRGLTNNPHSVDKTDVGLSNVPNVDCTNASNISSGTLPSSVLPPVALTTVQVASSLSAMLALTTEQGDVVVRSDLNKSYMKNTGTSGTISDFTELMTPTDSVLSVNGETGTVVLTTGDIGEDSNKKYVTDAQLTIINNTSNTNTGDQTNITGNAGTATKLQTARKIANVDFDGSADISLNNNAITNGAGYTTNTGDMTLSGVQSVTGAKTFTKDKLIVKGTGTGTTNLTTANTSTTSYTATLPAKTGTIAMTSDITGTNSGINTGDNSVNTLYSGLEASKEDAIIYPTENADSKYYRGDKTFHEIIIGSGGFAGNAYLSNTASTDVSGYSKVGYDLDATETEKTITVSSSGTTTDNYIYEAEVGVTTIPSGTWRAVFYGKINLDTGDSRGVFTIFRRETDGTEFDLFSITSEEMSGDEYSKIVVESSQDAFTVNSTDRLGVRCSATATSGVNKTINYIIGNGRGAYFNTPLQIRHDQLRDKDGEDAFQHLTLTNKTDLTDSGDTSLHYHSADRDRANHTGTQTASTISDFDTEVSNNSSVVANTAKVSFDWDYDYTDLINKPTTITTAQANAITANTAKVSYPGSADATELNILEGATLSTAELNKLDGFTGSYTDLNYAKDLNATGVSTTEFNYLDGVTSNIQTQFGAKVDVSGDTMTGELKLTGTYTAGESLVAGNLCYFKSDGKFWKVNADAEATSKGLLAICLGTIAASETGSFLLRGTYTTTGLTTADEMFISTTAGTWTKTKPSATGDIVRFIGYALSTTALYFNPDKIYVEVS